MPRRLRSIYTIAFAYMFRVGLLDFPCSFVWCHSNCLSQPSHTSQSINFTFMFFLPHSTFTTIYTKCIGTKGITLLVSLFQYKKSLGRNDIFALRIYINSLCYCLFVFNVRWQPCWFSAKIDSILRLDQLAIDPRWLDCIGPINLVT